MEEEPPTRQQERDSKSRAAVINCWSWRKTHTTSNLSKWFDASALSYSVGANESSMRIVYPAGQDWTEPNTESLISGKDSDKYWICGLNTSAWATVDISILKIPLRQLSSLANDHSTEHHSWRSAICCAKQDDCTTARNLSDGATIWLHRLQSILEWAVSTVQSSYTIQRVRNESSTPFAHCVEKYAS